MEKITHEQAHAKAKELVAQMTLEEKVFQMTYKAPAIERLGVPVEISRMSGQGLIEALTGRPVCS